MALRRGLVRLPTSGSGTNSGRALVRQGAGHIMVQGTSGSGTSSGRALVRQGAGHIMVQGTSGSGTTSGRALVRQGRKKVSGRSPEVPPTHMSAHHHHHHHLRHHHHHHHFGRGHSQWVPMRKSLLS